MAAGVRRFRMDENVGGQRRRRSIRRATPLRKIPVYTRRAAPRCSHARRHPARVRHLQLTVTSTAFPPNDPRWRPPGGTLARRLEARGRRLAPRGHARRRHQGGLEHRSRARDLRRDHRHRSPRFRRGLAARRIASSRSRARGRAGRRSPTRSTPATSRTRPSSRFSRGASK